MTDQAGKGEFGRIRDFFAPLTDGHADSFNLTDDAALLCVPAGERLVVTTDMIVRGVHFLDGDSPEDVAAKALRVNLSDLAAKGAAPIAYSLAMALPSSVTDDWVARFAQGLAADQRRFGLRLLGGDSASTPGPITISITAYGAVPVDCYPQRGNGRPGDLLFVSGSIGDGALGLMAARGLLGFGDEADRLARRYRRPEPQLALGRALRGKVRAAMDVSDGLIGDAAALAAASGCAVRIDTAKIPLSQPAAHYVAEDPDLMTAVLTGGDDYELLLAIAPDKADEACALADKAGTSIQRIGELLGEGRPGEVFAYDQDGNRLKFSVEKYAHT